MTIEELIKKYPHAVVLSSEEHKKTTIEEEGCWQFGGNITDSNGVVIGHWYHCNGVIIMDFSCP